MQMCNIPPWNNLWGVLGIGAFYDFDFLDQDICYKVLDYKLFTCLLNLILLLILVCFSSQL